MRDWARGLGVPTFVGSSGRVFPQDLKAAPLLRGWVRRLRAEGVGIHVHHRWLGWDDNRSGVVQLYTSMAQGVPGGFGAIDGFVTNTANYTPLTEPYLPDPNASINGQPVRSSSFYEWNPHFDELDFATALHRGGRLATYEVAISDDAGRRVCTARLTCMLVDRPAS